MDSVNGQNMADLKSLDELLSKAVSLLDSAAKEIRDIPLNPVKENIYKIGDALTSIFELQRQIYDADPDLESVKKQSSPGLTDPNG